MVNTDKIRSGFYVNGALIYALSLAWVFWLVWQTGDKSRLVYVMNSFLLGSLVALAVMYYRYFIFVLTNPTEWNRARQFVMSTSVLWGAVFLMTAASIWRNSTVEFNINNVNFLDLLQKYLAIIAAAMQVFAPHHGEPMTFKDERKTLIIASALGVVFALSSMVMQVENLLSW